MLTPRNPFRITCMLLQAETSSGTYTTVLSCRGSVHACQTCVCAHHHALQADRPSYLSRVESSRVEEMLQMGKQ